MDKRTAEIEGQIKAAEENQAAAITLREELEEQAKDSRRQARLFLDEATKRAEVLQAEMLEEARAETAALTRRAQEVIELEKEKAWAELKEQVAELSLLLASKVITQSLDEQKHQELIHETLGELDVLSNGHHLQ